MNHIPGNSLKNRLSLLMFLGMLILSALIVLGVYALTFKNAEHDAKQQVSELIDAMDYSASIALYANNAQIAEDVARSILRGSFVASIRLYNHGDLDIRRTNHPDAANLQVIQRVLHSPFDNCYVPSYSRDYVPPYLRLTSPHRPTLSKAVRPPKKARDKM